MLMKIAILIFILLIFIDYISIFKLSSLNESSISKYKNSIDRNGFTTTFMFSVFTSFLSTTYFGIFYCNIGRVNSLMAWLSAMQMILALYNSFKQLELVINIGNGENPKPVSILYLILTVMFDTFYISLAIMYMYLV